MLLKLLSATREKYCQAVISGKNEGTIGPRIKDLGIAVHTLRLHALAPNPLRAFLLRSLVREFRPHMIMGWMYHGNLLASLAGIFPSEPAVVVWNIRQSIAEIAAYGRRTAAVIRLGARLSRGPAAIVYNTLAGAKQHEAIGYCGEKGVVIPNGFDCTVFHPDEDARADVRAELGVASDSILVGLIARYHPMKDHVGFLTAAAEIARIHHSVYFVLAGPGVSREQPALSRLLHARQLEDRVFLLGERRDIARLNAALDIACSASAWGEGFSNAIGEAMACGIPCVVTDVGDSAYIIGDTGVLIPPDSPAALAQAIAQLVDAGPEHRCQLGLAARRRVESEFSLPLVAHKYEDLYQQLLPEAEKRSLNGLAATTKRADR